MTHVFVQDPYVQPVFHVSLARRVVEQIELVALVVEEEDQILVDIIEEETQVFCEVVEEDEVDAIVVEDC